MEVRITGAQAIARAAEACRRVGRDRTVIKEMSKEIRKAIAPIRNAIKVRAVEILPRRGGLGKWTAQSRITGLVRRAPTTAGVRIKGSKSGVHGKHDLRRLDLGWTRHPTWGRPPWHTQRVSSGFFTDAVTDEGLDQLEDAVIAAADRAQEKIVRGW